MAQKNENAALENISLTSLCSLSDQDSPEEKETTRHKGNYVLMTLLGELRKRGLRRVVMFDSSASENWPNPTSTGNTPVAKKAPGNKKKTALLLAHLPLPLQ